MIVNLTEKEALYLRSMPFWDWQQEKLKLHYYEIGILLCNQELKGTKNINRKIKFYHNLYKKLGGDKE